MTCTPLFVATSMHLLTEKLLKNLSNQDVFYGWVVQCLLPALPSNSVIVMDNATFHKRQDIQDAITQAGHILVYLPPYSPDLNPIEKNGRTLKLFADKKDVLSMNFSNSAFNNHFIGG